MTPASVIARLDRALERNGEDVVLRRTTGTAPQVTFDAPVRAQVRGYAPNEMTGGVLQGDSRVILSPTGLARAQWPRPGGPFLPQAKDRIVIAGRERAVLAVAPVMLGGQVVRIEMQVRG